MLQRDPKRRASLEEIEKHPWLQGVDPSPATKYNIPLVSYKNLSEEEHNSIIQRMVLGDIADRDAIVEYVSARQYGGCGFRVLGMSSTLRLGGLRIQGNGEKPRLAGFISFISSVPGPVPGSWVLLFCL